MHSVVRALRSGWRPRAARSAAWALALTSAALVVQPGAEAAAASPEVALLARGAPLASVLEHLAGLEGREARVAEEIVDRVDGPLVGDAASLIALLVDAHGLSLHREERTLWFDREGRTVIDFVPLERAMLVKALETLSRPVAPGGTVQVEASERGLVLSGTRAYVRTSLARIAMATGVEVEPPERPPGEVQAPLASLAPALEASDVDALAGQLVLVSARPPRYVELEGGARLVEGSVLADGQRLAAIERERLLFAEGGAETALALP